MKADRWAPLLLLVAASLCRAESPDTVAAPATSLPVIDTVVVLGNTKTEAYVILDEMTLKPGVMFSEEALAYDRNRIYSLGLFTTVDLFYDTTAGSRIVIVSVNERWHILPQLLVGFRDGDPKKFYFGAGFLHNNLRGRNQKLFVSATFGYDPGLSISYLDPLVVPANRLSLGISLSTAKIRNRSVIEEEATGQYDERHYDAAASLGKRFGLYHRVSLKLGTSVVTVSEYKPGRTASPDGTDWFVHLTGGYNFDSRDFAEYATRGSFVDVSISKVGFAEGDVHLLRLSADLRAYIPAPFGTAFVTRGFSSIVTGGDVPPYLRVYFGYGDRIRGYFSTVIEGEDIAGGNLEVRIPILKPQVIAVSFLPVPKEFSRLRYSAGLSFFADFGTAWFRGDPLTFSSFRSGYGASLDITLPYSLAVRLAVAWNDVGANEFILDLRRPI